MQTIRLATPILLTLALALPGCASAPKGNSPDFKVELNPATCKFSGGTDGAGNVEVDSGTGSRKIQVKLTVNQGYRIEPVKFSGEGADQMKSTGGGNAGVVNIFNRNSGPASVKYSVIVRNEATGVITDCDPRIINR